MKSLALVIGLAGVMFVAVGVGLAGDMPAKPTAPALKKVSGHTVPAPATKQTTPNPVSPPMPKPSLPVEAGKPRGAASIGGTTGASGHKGGTLNGTEVKRRP